MRRDIFIAAAGVFVAVAGLGVARSSFGSVAPVRPAGQDLRPVSAFAGISDPAKRSVALFEEAGKVIESPRCMNCHPRNDRPTQYDTMRPHVPWVVRGADGHGAPGLRCATCHQAENFEASRVPGNRKWQLAPAEMAWQGKSLGQICALIKDPRRNGGKDKAALVHHMADDELVGWGWHPGGGRTPAPGTQKQFGALIQAWLDTGGHCPG